MIFNEVELGQDGADYVISCLKQGTGLCTKILKVVAADRNAFAPMPDGVSPTSAKQFKVGGVMSRHDTLAWLGRHVETLHQEMPDGALILQDIWAKPDDPLTIRPGVGVFYNNSNVYYFLDADNVTSNKISQAAHCLQSYLLVAVFSNARVLPEDLSPTHCVAETVIDKIARNAREIYIGAYDQEGLVVWRGHVSNN